MPKFLLSKRFLTESVLIILGFAIIFMLVYRPFSATVWFGFSTVKSFAFTAGFFLACIAVVGASKWLMYRYQARKVLTVGRFLIWVLAEYIILAILYVGFTASYNDSDIPIDISVILKTSLCVGLILMIPYAFMSLLAAYQDQREEIEMLRYSLHAAGSEKMVMLYDYKGELAFSIQEHSIYYIEAQDNYVKVWYDADGSLQHYMMRCTTQKLESMIEGTALVRCHRSAIVNIKRMQNFMRGHNCATIILDNPEIKEISVSKSYYKSTLERILETNPSPDMFIKRT